MPTKPISEMGLIREHLVRLQAQVDRVNETLGVLSERVVRIESHESARKEGRLERRATVDVLTNLLGFLLAALIAILGYFGLLPQR